MQRSFSLVQYSLHQFIKIESIARQNRFTECHPTQRFDDIYDKNGIITFSTIAFKLNEIYLKCLDQSSFNGFMGEDDWHSVTNSSQPGEGPSANATVAQTRKKRDVSVSVLDKSQRLSATKKIGKENYSLLLLLQFH